MKEKTIKILFITLIAISFIGGSLGYFRPAIMGSGKHNFAVSANLEVTFNDVDTLTLKNNKPIYEADYKYKADYIDFSITGQNNTIEGCYTLYISVKEMTPNLKSEYFKWILYDLNKEQIYLEGDFSSYNNGDLKISNLMQLKRTTNDRYRLYIFLVNDEEENQTSLLNSSFSATVKGVSNDVCHFTLTETMLAAEEAKSDANIDYAYTSEGSNNIIDKPVLQSIDKFNEISKPDFLIKRDLSNLNKLTATDSSQITNGLYYTSDTTKTENGEVVYYYRGAVTNNYVVFGNYCWRIVRTVEDGSVRLRYGGAATQSGETYTCPQTGTAVNIATEQKYNTSYDDKSYVNYKTSAIRTTVENWYRDNIAPNTSLTELIADTPYCNDMTEPRINIFAAYDRLNTNKSPQYKCPSSTYGYTVAKGDITYPVGLLTADEVAYAGGVYNKSNSSYYLYTAQTYWTMSPSNFNSSSAFVFYVYSEGLLRNDDVYYSSAAVPVVSLKPETTVKRGTGAYNDPYVINTD